MENVLIWFGKDLKEFDKNELLRFLAKRSLSKEAALVNIALWNWQYNLKGNCYYFQYDYYSAYDFILRNLAFTTCIQIYSDGVVRLHLKHEHYETPKSIYLDDYRFVKNNSTQMLEELKTYFFE